MLRVSELDVDMDGASVLRGVGFEAAAGQVVGLIGPNGAGKTTLLRAICQLIPARAGHIEWDGRSLAGITLKTRAATLAYLPQGQAIHWPLTVRRLVELGRLPSLGPLGRLTAADAAAIEDAMAACEVTSLADRDTRALSGGERARVLLARALAVQSPVLLVDEPTASLDPYHALQVMAVLRRAAGEGRLVICVMHELGLVSQFCDRVVLLKDGRLVAQGAPAAVLTPERLRQVYRIDAGALSAFGLPV